MTKFSKIKLNKNIYDILKMMLPKQGSIEIQRDFPKNTIGIFTRSMKFSYDYRGRIRIFL